MTKVLKIKVYSDPSHGWGAVKIDMVKQLGIESKISSYSYLRGKSVYAEEDSDLSLVIETARGAGYEVHLIHKSNNSTSPIRSYERYDASKI